MHKIRTATLTLAIALAMTAAHAQTTIITEPAPPAAVITSPPAVIPVPPATVITTDPLVLTPVQRQVIYRTIVREPVVQQQMTVGTAAPVVEYRIGTRVPATTTLYPVPREVAVEVPTVRDYRYMVINSRAWLVDPATSEIVAEISE